jgi:hypothetical protein
LYTMLGGPLVVRLTIIIASPFKGP